MSAIACFLCPDCGSAAVDASSSALAASEVTCRKCGWKSNDTERPIMSAFEVADRVGAASSIQDEAVQAYMTDVRDVVAKELAVPLGRLMIKWGFLDRKKVNVQLMSKYLSEISRSIATVLITVREEVEVKHD